MKVCGLEILNPTPMRHTNLTFEQTNQQCACVTYKRISKDTPSFNSFLCRRTLPLSPKDSRPPFIERKKKSKDKKSRLDNFGETGLNWPSNNLSNFFPPRLHFDSFRFIGVFHNAFWLIETHIYWYQTMYNCQCFEHKSNNTGRAGMPAKREKNHGAHHHDNA